MLSPDGVIMCKCDKKRANWYLSRNLAEIVSDDPLIFRLLFVPNGHGTAGDTYSLLEKENRCVVCGKEHDLTKHHIVPYMYRKHLPMNIKSRNAHDVVLICNTCHHEYEEEAMKLKNEINIELTGDIIRSGAFDRSVFQKVHIAKMCRTLARNGHKIYESRRKEMIKDISESLGQEATPELIQSIVDNFNFKNPYHHVTYDPGALAVNSLGDDTKKIKEFVEMWRRHFIDVAQPKFLSPHWEIERELTRA
jgi:hypothetical protein